jgi:hypothetical protein
MRSMTGEGGAASSVMKNSVICKALIRRAARATFSRERGRREENAYLPNSSFTAAKTLRNISVVSTPVFVL